MSDTPRTRRSGPSSCVASKTGACPRSGAGVPREVGDAYERPTTPDDRISEHLRAAWAGVYNLNPNPTAGYDHAVNAVEAAAWPVVTPDDEKATLGKIISASETEEAGSVGRLRVEGPSEAAAPMPCRSEGRAQLRCEKGDSMALILARMESSMALPHAFGSAGSQPRTRPRGALFDAATVVNEEHRAGRPLGTVRLGACGVPVAPGVPFRG
jgi:hypothetical protein